MGRSTTRILTTHTGSLPRPDDLTRLMFAKGEGVPVDGVALAERVRQAVDETVRRQAACGLDVINDGEVSKPGFSTYVTERLSGFGGEGHTYYARDLLDYPDLAARFANDPGRAHRRNPGCDAPVAVSNPDPLRRDLENLVASLREVRCEEAFLTAASPGIIALTMRNHYYPSHEAYLSALADAMREEYEAIVAAGFVLQVDCPDLAMGRQTWFADASLEEFLRTCALHVEALNHALANLPPDRLRLHVCWGNYAGPHTYDVPFKNLAGMIFSARPAAISIEAANPRHEHEWQVFEEVRLPEGKLLIPGVIDSCTNYVEHPELVAQRIQRYAGLVGRENVIAGVDCGFGTFVGSATVDPGVAWAKLRSLVEGARFASAALW